MFRSVGPRVQKIQEKFETCKLLGIKDVHDVGIRNLIINVFREMHQKDNNTFDKQVLDTVYDELTKTLGASVLKEIVDNLSFTKTFEVFGQKAVFSTNQMKEVKEKFETEKDPKIYNHVYCIIDTLSKTAPLQFWACYSVIKNDIFTPNIFKLFLEKIIMSKNHILFDSIYNNVEHLPLRHNSFFMDKCPIDPIDGIYYDGIDFIIEFYAFFDKHPQVKCMLPRSFYEDGYNKSVRSISNNGIKFFQKELERIDEEYTIKMMITDENKGVARKKRKCY